jgi:hypothetical protein
VDLDTVLNLPRMYVPAATTGPRKSSTPTLSQASLTHLGHCISLICQASPALIAPIVRELVSTCCSLCEKLSPLLVPGDAALGSAAAQLADRSKEMLHLVGVFKRLLEVSNSFSGALRPTVPTVALCVMDEDLTAV